MSVFYNKYRRSKPLKRVELCQAILLAQDAHLQVRFWCPNVLSLSLLLLVVIVSLSLVVVVVLAAAAVIYTTSSND